MRIVRLTASNVKKLKVADITAQPGMNKISGKNGNGKSSLLDSIVIALAGKSAIPSKPIREGTEEAVIRLDLGEIIVKRTITKDDEGGFRTSVLVLNPTAAPAGTPDKKLPKWSSPQEMLDSLLGELTFDPLKFARMKAREQFDELRRISKLSVNIDELNDQNAADYTARTNINRDAKSLRSRAEAILIPPDTPDHPLDESVLLDAIEQSAQFNADIEKRRGNRERARKEIAELRQKAKSTEPEIERLRSVAQSSIQELRRQIEQIGQHADHAVKDQEVIRDSSYSAAEALESKLIAAPELPEPNSVAELRQGLDAAKKANESVKDRARRIQIESEATAMEAESEQITRRMADRDRQKLDAIQKAELPIVEVGFGDGCVTYRGLPLDQASEAEKIRVSASIAMAANPKLRIIRIKDGALLDDDSMSLLAQMAEEKDYQVWIEVVQSSDPMAIVMEDGEVRS